MSRRTILSTLAILLLALTTAAPGWAGVHYVAETVTTGGTDSRTTVEAWVEGPSAKIVFTESDQPMLDESDYLLTTDGGQTLYLVDPEEETYMEWDLAGMMAAFGSVMDSMQGLMNMEFKDVEVELVAQEPGGEVLGYPTTRYEYDSSYTMSIKVMGMGRESTTRTEQEMWVTDALDDVGLGVWLRTEPPATGIEGLDEMIASEMDKVRGFPLKTVSTSRTVNKKGREQGETTTVMEVTEIEETSVPASTFEIPAGYEKQEMAQMEGEGEEEGSNPFGGLFKREKEKEDGGGR